MAKKNVIIFDGEDKFISKKKHVYNKNKGKSIYIGADGDEQSSDAISVGTPMPEVSTSTITTETIEPTPTPTPTPTPQSCPEGWFWGGTQCIHQTPVACPDTSIWNGSAWVCPDVIRNAEYIERPQPIYIAPTPELPSYNYEDDRKTIMPIYDQPVTVNAPTPTQTSNVSANTTSSTQSTTKECPPGFRDYNGVCVPITNTLGACQQGYMKQYVGGPCVPVPPSTAIGGCAAGYEYKMGYVKGNLTATMGCYPMGSTQDISLGSSTGEILGGGAGTNIGGGGTVQGGGGNYGSGGGTSSGGSSTITCSDSQIFDPITGSCIPKYTTAPVPCPAGFVRDEKTNTCIQSVNPKDYECPKVDLPTPPKCKKYAVVGKDQFGCDRYDLVDDAANCPDVIKEEPINCQDGLIYSVALKKCVNPIDETKKPPISTPEGTCPEGFEFNIEQQKCISKCPQGMTYDVVNKICVSPKKDEPKKIPYCSQNMVWDEAQQKCVFTGTVEPAPVTKATTSTTTTTTTISSGGGNLIIPGLGIAPVGGSSGKGGSGGGGGEKDAPKAVAPKNYFWYYVGAGALGFYLLRKILK